MARALRERVLQRRRSARQNDTGVPPAPAQGPGPRTHRVDRIRRRVITYTCAVLERALAARLQNKTQTKVLNSEAVQHAASRTTRKFDRSDAVALSCLARRQAAVRAPGVFDSGRFAAIFIETSLALTRWTKHAAAFGRA